ncbi:Hypothetical protein SRAE_1000154100 [Strongyloides ratti]|uniref:Uncharacterized protein n=1 Tax=Strongyloides ratti TaxID=34506 RepID=A0A090MW05_STRRB|nr:Hypothetical protein SRAE_1000154100 [Strongyloides ratti]CEF63278.1 Hypothetical protein SRAE_1000154100 [Strongyloides ratti]
MLLERINSQNNNEDDTDNYNEDDMNIMTLSNDVNKYYNYLYKKMVQNGVKTSEKDKEIPLQDQLIDIPVIESNIEVPGPFEALPGRSYKNDYVPLFPLSSQYTGGFDYDPLEGRHFGGDFGVSIPSWGIMNIQGHIAKRWQDTTGTFGYLAHPVNMLGFDKKDYLRLINNPSMLHNREIQPTIGLGKIPRNYVPLSCKAPFCNPYKSTFGVGVDIDGGGIDGINGDFQIDVPVSKNVAFQLPIGGNIYYDLENVTVTYGQHISPIDPQKSLFIDDNFHSRIKRNINYNIYPEIFKKFSVKYLVPEFIEIPLVYKLYPYMKPIYISSIKKRISSISSPNLVK